MYLIMLIQYGGKMTELRGVGAISVASSSLGFALQTSCYACARIACASVIKRAMFSLLVSRNLSYELAAVITSYGGTKYTRATDHDQEQR